MPVKSILITAGTIIFIIFFIPIFLNILNPGNMAGMLIGFAMFSAGLFHKMLHKLLLSLWSTAFGKGIVIILAVTIAFSVIYVSVLTVFIISARTDKPENPSAVIVLGCKVKENRPSKMLRRRLDAAVNFLKEDHDIICVVSGGKGDDEIVAEAEAMKQYLIDNGINADRIIKEDRSKNTYENLENSFRIAGIVPGQEVVIVTDGFHQYRAGYIAKLSGVNTTAVNPDTTINGIILAPTYTVREWMAITNEYRKHLFLSQHRTKRT